MALAFRWQPSEILDLRVSGPSGATGAAPSRFLSAGGESEGEASVTAPHSHMRAHQAASRQKPPTRDSRYRVSQGPSRTLLRRPASQL